MSKIAASQNLKEVEAALAKARSAVLQTDARRRDVNERLIQLEKSASPRNPTPSDLTDHLDQILEGSAAVVPPQRPDAITTLRAEKELLMAAIARGNRRCDELALQRATLIYAHHMPEIKALEKQRVLLATELQAVNRMREALRDRLTAIGCGGQFFPTDFADLLGIGDKYDEVREAQARVIEDGILTKGEIDRVAIAS